MSLRDLLNDAIKFDEPKLAYTIFWASQHGLSLDKDFESLKLMDIDHAAVDELVKLNPLGIQQIKLFSHKEGQVFHLVLAKDEKEARGEIYSRIGRLPNQMHDVTHGMDNVLWNDEKRKSVYIRKIKDTALSFPTYVGIVEKG